MSIRALIIDDEPLARERLRGLLKDEPDIEVIGECRDGAEALREIQRQQPDLLFLDMEMPEMDGLTLLSRLEVNPFPVVVFVTAHAKFALKAFEVNALDYLLKPFDRSRFQKALARAREQLQLRKSGQLTAQMAELLAGVKEEGKPLRRLAVKTGGRVVLVRVEEIDWIEATDNYVNLHCGEKSHLLRETMASLEGKLDPAMFLRISRSAIVNVDRVKEMQPLFHGEYAVILEDGTRLTLSRTYREKLNQLLGKEV
ncbi:MAG: LytTR family DNA-binding domain-containing protein [Verrucomicrobiota bacterium]